MNIITPTQCSYCGVNLWPIAHRRPGRHTHKIVRVYLQVSNAVVYVVMDTHGNHLQLVYTGNVSLFPRARLI